MSDTLVVAKYKRAGTSRRRHESAITIRRLIETSNRSHYTREYGWISFIYVTEAVEFLNAVGLPVGEHVSREIGTIIEGTEIVRTRFVGMGNRWILYLGPVETESDKESDDG